MVIDGVFASEAIDSSGEILDVKGCDTTDFEEGRGVLNYEHRGDDAPGASPNDIIGKILSAKKIYKASDCEDDRQLEYWKKLKLPFIYGTVRLFDGAGHPGAVAAAAIIRDAMATGDKLLVQFSIEGTTLSKKGNRIESSIARRVAFTLKACNKSCESGVISDPNDPQKAVKKSEHPHPLFTQLGGEAEVREASAFENLEKAITAGVGNVAPGSLVGGSALQVEDKTLKNQVRAAMRDWNRVQPFRKFLKFRLPEVSEDFIDRFADLVDDYALKKAQSSKKPAGPPPLTIRGQPVPPNPGLKEPHFDEGTGTLHTEQGSFPMYIPSRDPSPGAKESFHRILNNPKVRKFHDNAMKNWVVLHQRLKAGNISPSVLQHATLFAQLSPNTPVPMQELMYGHLVDSMKHTGIDLAEHNSPAKLQRLKRDWLDRDQPATLPTHSADHYQRLLGVLRNKKDSETTGRKAGELGAFMLAENKFANMSKYHEMHPQLMELVGRHRHDARSGVEELMAHKLAGIAHEGKRSRQLKANGADIGPYTVGPSVNGLATKTARYMYGMIGGGNVTVPDTHFARYLFGLDKKLDGATIQHIRNEVLWNPRKSHIMNAIDRYYAQHHDAVQHMLNDPKYKGVFEKPEDANFPAFWKNWVAIVPHEKMRGMTSGGFNEGTDHKPYWDAVMKKHEEGDSLPERTAKIHAEWAAKHGEVLAMAMYYHYLVPQLLDHDQTMSQGLAKAEEEPKDYKPPSVLSHTAVDFNGKKVIPGTFLKYKTKKNGGFATIGGQAKDYSRHALLGSDDEFHYHVPEGFLATGWSPQDLEKTPKRQPRESYMVMRPARDVGADLKIDPEKHSVGDFNHHPDVKQMVSGFDFSQRMGKGEVGMNQARSFWGKNAEGKSVYVKYEKTPYNAHSDVTREAGFYNLARDVFGLGDLVPKTALVRHPATGQHVAIVEGMPGEHYDDDAPAPEHIAQINNLGDEGTVHKIAMMDAILANDDRHQYNYLLRPNGGVALLDHGRSFSDDPENGFALSQNHLLDTYDGLRRSPRWEGSDGGGDMDYNNYNPHPMHPEASKWLLKLDPQQLDLQMRRLGFDDNHIHESVRRLMGLKKTQTNPGLRIETGNDIREALNYMDEHPYNDGK